MCSEFVSRDAALAVKMTIPASTIIYRDALSNTALLGVIQRRIEAGAFPFRIKSGKSLPPIADLVIGSLGVGIKLFLHDFDALEEEKDRNWKLNEVEIKKYTKQLFRYQFFILERPPFQIVSEFQKVLAVSGLESKTLSAQLIVVSNAGEICDFLTKVSEDLSPPTIARLQEHVQQNRGTEKICNSKVIQEVANCLPLEQTQAQVLMEVFGTFEALAKSTASDIMSQTPLSADDALRVEQFFNS